MALRCYVNKKYLDYDVDRPHVNYFEKYSLLLIGEILILPFLFLIYSSVTHTTPKSYAQFSPIQPSNEVVLGAAVTPTQTPQPTLTPFPPQPTTTSTPTPPPPESVPAPAKKDYSIAVYGDSMVDTMGERLEYLEHALKSRYPGVNFTLYNFGKGSENVEMGLGRFGSPLDYQDRHYSSLPSIKPDILIIGSFAYNPFSPYDRNRHWVGLTKLVEQAKTVSSHVYMLAEIAPLRSNFGKGPNGVNWDDATAYTHSGHIIEQLENAVALSKDLGIPLIDVYHASGANPSYTNPSDGIHPSVTGHEFTAERIAASVILD